MRLSIRIAGQIRRSVFHEGWHGPAIYEVLHGLDASKSGAKTPIASHSIWQLIQHMRAWHEAVLDALQGKPLPSNEEAERLGWEPIPDLSEACWQMELRRFRDCSERLIQRTATLEDKKINEQVPGRAYDIGHMLLGVASHNTYHCGQIVLLHRYLYLHK
ncbi:DinB family protein [Bryobacter aggregatus]|uniref:DinB family protein n=1 Tax=Bryobacter aggregatus TaxID=360054 RepID=UPI0004E18FF6|nr:DinB family protein [Bryobacter aggregatus]